MSNEIVSTQSPKIDNIDLIKYKIEIDAFDLSNVPCQLSATSGEVLVNYKFFEATLKMDGPFGKEQEKLMVVTPKLQVEACGGWEFVIRLIHIDYFESRDDLDKFAQDDGDIDPEIETYKYRKQISIDEAFQAMQLSDVSVNLKFYKTHPDELELDLGKKIDSSALEDPVEVKKISNELFYAQMCKIFGGRLPNLDGQGDEKRFMLEEFHLLCYDGNNACATARRGSFYFVFDFITS